jgi:CDP-diacylglycerol--serine O-phosphatidyltransferase
MFNPANLLTAFNLLGGCFSIFFAMTGKLDWAVYSLLCCGIFDFFDGFVARLLKLNNPIGKDLDSLADVVSFGVAPGIIMMVMIVLGIDQEALMLDEQGRRLYQGSIDNYVPLQIMGWTRALIFDEPNFYNASIKFLPFVGFFIPFISMFRLAKFNNDSRQTNQFIGVPTPFNTFFFSFFPLYFVFNLDNWGHLPTFMHQLFDCYTLAGITLIFPLLMLANIPLIALKFKDFTWRNNLFKYLLLGCSLSSIVLLKLWSIPIIVLLYVIFSMINNTQNTPHEI